MLRRTERGLRRKQRSPVLVWLLVVAISVGGALAAGQLAYWLLPYSYAATSSMLISSQPDVIAAIIAGGARNLAGTAASSDALVAPATSGALGSLWAILTSREMLLRIAHKHDLMQELSLSESDAIAVLDGMSRFEQIGNVGVRVTVTCRGSRWPHHGLFFSSPLSLEKARQMCAELANSYLTELDKYFKEANLSQASQMREFLQTSKGETEEQLQSIDQRLEILQTSHAFLGPQNKAAQLLERLKTVEPAYAEAVAHSEEVAKMHQAARIQLGEIPAMRISQEVMTRNPVITTLEQKLAQLHVDLDTERAAGKTGTHPDIVKLQTAIASTEHELQRVKEEVREQILRQTDPAHDSVVAKVVDLETEMVGVQARKAEYGRLRRAIQTELAQLPAIEREYVSLKRQQEQYAQLLAPLAQGLGLVGLVEKYSRASRFLRLDTAVPPQRPTTAAALLIAIITFVVLLGLSIGVAYRRGALGGFRM